MAKKILTLDDELDDDFSLIAIVGQVESYKLAFNINQELGLNLKRSRKDYDVKIKGEMAFFDIYEKENEADDEYFYLIRTIGQNEIQDAPPENLNLFGQSEEKRAVLIPALKKVDYLLKFKTPKVSADEILRKLKIIPPVALAYMVEDPAIISHKNLIFY